MKNEVFIHIGTPKTGTTTLQNLFTTHEDLFKEHGISYLVSGRFRINHKDLMTASQFFDVIHKDYLWSKAVNEISRSKYDKFLISHEAFYNLDEPRIQFIYDKLSCFDVKVILYLREPSSFLLSYYKFDVVSGGAYYSFQEYINRNIDKIDYSCILRKWQRYFGVKCIMVFSYEQVKSIGLVRHFLETVGIENLLLNQKISNYQNCNISFCESTIKCLIVINKAKLFLPFFLGLKGKSLLEVFQDKSTTNVLGIKKALSVSWLKFWIYIHDSICSGSYLGNYLEKLIYTFARYQFLYSSHDLANIKDYFRSLDHTCLQVYYPEVLESILCEHESSNSNT